MKGLKLTRRFRIDALWSTYPLATAHLIALALHRLTAIRWVADFRDPMVETDPLTGDQHPRDPTLRRIHGWIERRTMRSCDAAVFTTPGATAMYAERYAALNPRIATIANGFDEESFRDIDNTAIPATPVHRPILLLHSGLLYPEARDPRTFFAAVAELVRHNKLAPQDLRIIFRGAGNEAQFRSLVQELHLQEIISFEPAIPYTEALREMARADGLLIFQASNCNSQIPAKLYEYLRSRRPILALTDPHGDTGRLIREEGMGRVVPLDSKTEVTNGLESFLRDIRVGEHALASEATIQRHSRKARTQELATLLDSLAPSAIDVGAYETRSS